MKKLIGVFLLCLFFSACDSSDPDASTQKNTDTQVEKPVSSVPNCLDKQIQKIAIENAYKYLSSKYGRIYGIIQLRKNNKQYAQQIAEYKNNEINQWKVINYSIENRLVIKTNNTKLFLFKLFSKKLFLSKLIILSFFV